MQKISNLVNNIVKLNKTNTLTIKINNLWQEIAGSAYNYSKLQSIKFINAQSIKINIKVLSSGSVLFSYQTNQIIDKIKVLFSLNEVIINTIKSYDNFQQNKKEKQELLIQETSKNDIKNTKLHNAINLLYTMVSKC